MNRLILSSLMVWALFANISASAADDQSAFAFDGKDGLLLRSFAVERILTYQGILKDNSGNPVGDASYNLTFRLYNASVGGTLLWTSPVMPVTTSGGYFSTQLGPVLLRFDIPYYLSIQVEDDIEMPQRQKLTTTPYSATADTANYAFRADTALYVVGGTSNWHVDNSVIYTNGYWGIARGNSSNNLYGMAAQSHTNLGSASNTGTDGYNYPYCTIAGGANNSASASYSTVAGGMQNSVSGGYGTVAGGRGDSVRAIYGGALSGYSNYAGDAAEDTGAFIGGGVRNSASDKYATVSGGSANKASAPISTVIGGYGNTAIGRGSVVGGIQDSVIAGYGGILSGNLNKAGESESDTGACVAGGQYNEALGMASFIGSGRHNVIDATYGFIGAGLLNKLDGNTGAICSGDFQLNSGEHSVIAGGSRDTCDDSGDYNLIYGFDVYSNDNQRVVFFNSIYDGSLNVNRDGRDGFVYSHPIQVGADTDDGNGAYLSSGGVWTNASSRTFKENFTPFDGNELLNKISNLSITTWNYKQSAEKHVGPVAEEFVEAFDTGVIRENDGRRDDLYLASGDVAGVALAGVQEIIKQNQELRSMIKELKEEINELKAQSK